MSKVCWVRKFSHHKKFEKAERATNKDEDDMVLCSLITENKKENAKKKVWFAEDVKQPSKAGMMCSIDGDTFFHLPRIPGSKTQVHHVISPMTILAYMTSPTSMSPSKVAPVLCPLQRRGN